MSSLTRNLTSVPQSIYEESVSQLAPLGTRLSLSDGREFVYCANAAVALASGRLIQSALALTGHEDLVVATAGVAGGSTITATLGATLTTENQYAEGYCAVTDDTGDVTLAGGMYRISGHAAAAASAAQVLRFADPLPAALATTNTVTLVYNRCDQVITKPASAATSGVIGVPLIDVTASYFFWAQAKGPTPVLTDGTLLVGNIAGVSDGVAGAVAPLTPASDEPHVGIVVVVNATATLSVVDFNL